MSLLADPDGGRRAGVDVGGTAPLGQILLARGWITEGRLAEALAEQQRTGARLGEVLVADGSAEPEHVAAALAEQWGLGYADLARNPPERSLLRAEDLDLYLKYRILPWRKAGKVRAYVTAEPQTARAALAALDVEDGMAITVVVSRWALDQAMLDLFAPELSARAASRTPAELSVRSLGLARLGLIAALVALLTAFAARPEAGLVVLGFLLLGLCGATALVRLAAMIASRAAKDSEGAAEGAVLLADRRPLPRISLLVPLFREHTMIGEIAAALEKIDYPHALLDVKLLLEERDTDTLTAVRAAKLPAWISPLVLPNGAPRTKPRALNMALDFCRGDIIGILDAEDRPHPSQLSDVAAHLRAAPPETACVQCQLAYFNARENWITRCFQIEYAIWFEVLLRGWQRLGLPIPLGGTSVYFRRSALVDLGGWDAHNVTEDADLGIRLARRGLQTAVLRSTTEEEANCRLMPWIRQRSRWLKGYMLTWLSHMRRPDKLWRDLGARGFLGFQVLFLGGVASYLAMPLFWAALAATVLAGRSVYGPLMPDAALTVLGIVLVSGQAVMLACALLALARRRALGLAIWVPTLVFYWTLGAAAAWKALIELGAAPYYWDKTRHGISQYLGQPPRSER